MLLHSDWQSEHLEFQHSLSDSWNSLVQFCLCKVCFLPVEAEYAMQHINWHASRGDILTWHEMTDTVES